jgi:hypothetical protein
VTAAVPEAIAQFPEYVEQVARFVLDEGLPRLGG